MGSTWKMKIRLDFFKLIKKKSSRVGLQLRTCSVSDSTSGVPRTSSVESGGRGLSRGQRFSSLHLRPHNLLRQLLGWLRKRPRLGQLAQSWNQRAKFPINACNLQLHTANQSQNLRLGPKFQSWLGALLDDIEWYPELLLRKEVLFNSAISTGVILNSSVFFIG